MLILFVGQNCIWKRLGKFEQDLCFRKMSTYNIYLYPREGWFAPYKVIVFLQSARKSCHIGAIQLVIVQTLTSMSLELADILNPHWLKHYVDITLNIKILAGIFVTGKVDWYFSPKVVSTITTVNAYLMARLSFS